jgi:hypothetical protein
MNLNYFEKDAISQLGSSYDGKSADILCKAAEICGAKLCLPTDFDNVLETHNKSIYLNFWIASLAWGTPSSKVGLVKGIIVTKSSLELIGGDMENHVSKGENWYFYSFCPEVHSKHYVPLYLAESNAESLCGDKPYFLVPAGDSLAIKYV